MEIYELEPQCVWRNFHALTQIPRPSGYTEQVANYLVDFAQKNGAEAFIDDAGNVVMRKAATPGYENRETAVLQAHMDMVPQKVKESTHNFETDPIETYIDGEWVRARGTTLGSDNGMGVAAAMAVIEDKQAQHGPIEVLITKDEETGMYGAFGLKAGVLNGKYLLNLDSETEGEITIGCAGGMDVVCSMEYQPLNIEPESMEAFRIAMKGLRGGHSGLEINEGRANANKLMARLLFAAVGTECAWLCSWHGGNMRNAIPREGEAVVVVPTARVEELKELVAKCREVFNKEFEAVENGNIELTIEPCEMPKTAVPAEIQKNLINAVMAAHDGVLRYIPTIPHIVETSSNLAIVRVEDGKAEIAILARSSADSMKQWLCNSLLACFSMAGMKVQFEGGYSGWQPNTKSPLVAAMADVYERMYGKKPTVEVCHAGLECGIIGVNYPDMDMASFGPTLRSPHTPDERCHIPTVGRFYDYLLEILKNIPEK
ncbi:MAG: aminoacyl-histidine dipeptidase [Prevotellaceae bacterium]|nr:aminoacyl-histidine dipeptidase [Prevotellaceae bacterium]